MANRPIWPVQPLHDAADVPLSSNPGTLPNMADTVANWFQLIVMEKVTKSTVNFQLVETTTPMQFQGFVVTSAKRQLKMMPNGQRLWKTKTLYTWPTIILIPDDIVIYEGIQYRVGQSADYKQYGFLTYELLQDYTGSNPIGGE